MNARRIMCFFEERRSKGESLVMATVINTGGSTYSKAGEQMLIDSEGNFCGMLSGGCLEGDLVERSRSVMETGTAQTVTYDLSSDDELWGLGVGCEGTMHILLQALSPENSYEPFASVVKVLNGHVPRTIEIHADDVTYSVVVLPSPSLLIMGAGLDSEPVVKIATELGWRCSVVDHRPAYISSRSFGDGVVATCVPADDLSSRLDLSIFDLALVMSHHLVSDRSYLRQLASTDIGYVGLLGPPKRRDRLLGELGDLSKKFQGRIHAPAGIQLGGRGPGPIAVEIIAEMQQFLAKHQDL